MDRPGGLARGNRTARPESGGALRGRSCGKTSLHPQSRSLACRRRREALRADQNLSSISLAAGRVDDDTLGLEPALAVMGDGVPPLDAHEA